MAQYHVKHKKVHKLSTHQRNWLQTIIDDMDLAKRWLEPLERVLVLDVLRFDYYDAHQKEVLEDIVIYYESEVKDHSRIVIK